MRKKLAPPLLIRNFIVIVTALLMSFEVGAQLPTAKQIASRMKVGWNMGNTLEAICGETAWGGAVTTQKLIDSVKAAGFNSIRLPCAWFCHSDTITNVIDSAWLARVKEIVDYCINDSMYVIINIHWDSGWLENHVTVADSAMVNVRQHAYWTQIAKCFKDYDEHLLFACANEPNDQDKAIGRTVFETYIQTFIKAVRATGGNNSSRTLIFQGHAEQTTKIPEDQIADRLMFEAHYYPFQFSILDKDKVNPWCGGCGDTLYVYYYWGKGNHSKTDVKHNSTYGEEADVDKFFGTLKSRFVDKGVPIILGEYGAWKRKLSPPADQELHNKSIESFYYYMVKAALKNGAIPFCWDTPVGLFNRSTGEINDHGIMDAMLQGSTAVNDTSSNGIAAKYKTVEYYSNPFLSTFKLKVDNPDEIQSIANFDMLGKQVEAIMHSAIKDSLYLGSSLKPNIYVVQVYADNWTESFKILKK